MTLIDYLPPCYGGPEVRAISGALDEQLVALWAARDGLFDQLEVATATWGLEAWERALGLSTERSKPDAYRRTRVLSKLRGAGTTTVAMLQNVAESFSNGAVEILEQPGAYHFDIKFVGTIGIPPNMDDLSAAIEEIKPAHLGYDYIIIFRTWGQVAAKRWGALTGTTWGNVKGGAI